MKRLLPLPLFLGLLVSLYAETPQRTAEFGIDFEAGFANNYINFGELFSSETLVIDLNTLPLGGLNTAVAAEGGLFVNVNIKQFSFGWFAGVDTFFTGGLSGEMAKLFSRGNIEMQNFSGEVLLGGSAFLDTGLKAAMDFKGWKFGFSPSLFIPLIYMPRPLIRLDLDTADSLFVDMTVRMNIYTPFPMDTMEFSGDFFRGTGLDLSLFAEYALLPILDVGGIMSHIPIVPSRLNYGMYVAYQFAFPADSGDGVPDANLIDAMINDELPEFAGDTFYLDGNFLNVFRPLRFDVFARYKPFKNEFITVKPMIGLSFLTIYGYDTTCFNAELAGGLNLGNLFLLDLSTGYRERLWRHKLGIALNFRVVELDLGVALMSPDFKTSFNLSGLSVAFGLRFGY
ncbi:MAG: hypothetical protein LBQ38_07125 [Spirochaetaceae bacterium]|jgi:hypothetical protein|nr:hypothetical protein [Spirochaetaceae bacterium]